MQFNINRPPKYIKRELNRKARQEWHRKFAWKITKVDETDEGHKVVLFEDYWRKERIGPTSPESKGDGHYFEKYSKKEYFKKKLDGNFDSRSEKPDISIVPRGDIIQQIKNQMKKQIHKSAFKGTTSFKEENE